MIAVPKGPHEPGRDFLTGLSCPDCPGVLTAQAHPGGRIVFECRIGHVYESSELIEEKERRAEDRLWAAVAALEELAALLRDLGIDPSRADRAIADSQAIRVLIAGSERTRLEGP